MSHIESFERVLSWNEEALHPQPNVTDLTLDIPPRYVTESRLIEKYLECVPHLTRLKLEFKNEDSYSDHKGLSKTNLAFIEALPKLEHLTIYQAEMPLFDCAKLASLKSLFLQFCVIKSDPSDDGPIVLTALEHVRVDRVKVDGVVKNGSFPIQLNERQPPIAPGRYQPNVFTSNTNF